MQEHTFNLVNRNKAYFTGVNDVKSFDETEIVLDTVQGMLIIQGKLLHVKRLSLENGEADIEGIVDRMLYSKKKSSKNDYKKGKPRIIN